MGIIKKVIGKSIGAFGDVVGIVKKNKRTREDRNQANLDKMKAELDLKILESTRQEIINPYADVVDLSGGLTNTFGDLDNKFADLGNPFANLAVATGAAEIQMQQSDAALANTLDTLRATGAGAGGATALAQAALQSKKGVAASIETQEAANSKAAAQGEANNQKMEAEAATNIQMAAAQGESDLQKIKMAEATRVQDSEVAGKAFVFGETEKREVAALDRSQQLLEDSKQNQVDAENNRRDFEDSSWEQVSEGGYKFAN